VGDDQAIVDLISQVMGQPITEPARALPVDPPYAAAAAEQQLGQELDLPVDEIDLVSFERVEWPDACLGLAEPGELCAEVLTPGWRVTLNAQGQQYEFHTDMNGDKLRGWHMNSRGTPGQIDGAGAASIEGLTVTLDVDPALATGVTEQRIPAAGQDGNAPYWAVHPDYLRLGLENYVRADTFHEARIEVYPVSAFAATNEAAAAQIAALREMLAQRPLAATGDLPFLPLFNAGQMIQSQFEYWAFESGTGVRFVTQYSQAALPVNNHELFYTFQGLTDDGNFYVTALLPVSHPDLPADASQRPEGDWESYIQGVEQQLNAADPSSFAPDLRSLDQMIRTLTLESGTSASVQEEALPAIDCTVFYRPAATAAGQAKSQERIVSLAKGGDQETVNVGDLSWRARYVEDAFEGLSLLVSVQSRETGGQLMQHLYQFLPEGEPRNQFAGGHGFTGLTYVYPPASSAELQYFCRSRS
jgi:hypothetical protein